MMSLSAAAAPALTLESQAFETDVAGVPVARLTVARAPANSVAAELAGAVAAWKQDRRWLVSCRVPENWAEIRAALEAAGFLAVEALVTFYQAARTPRGTAAETGLARPDEIDACVDLALGAFTFDRMHRDDRVPHRVADAIRAAWVRNDMTGRAAAPLVVRQDGRVAGFNLCLLKDRTAVIDLIAVGADFRRQGLAAQMIEAAFGHFQGRIDGIRVGTQEANQASMRLYEGAGFVVERREVTFHWINPEVTP